MAALSLMLVTVWLKSEKKNPAFALWPTLFMYITTIAATVLTAYNLWATVLTKDVGTVPLIGAWLMVIVAILLVVAALFIGYDGWQAYQRYDKGGEARKAPAAADD
jgi:carbon starvation protein CstA